MAYTVKLELVDNATKKVLRSAESQAKSMEKVGTAADKATKRVTKGYKQQQGEAKKATKETEKLAGSVMKVGKAWAMWDTARRAGSFLLDTATYADQTRISLIGLRQVEKNVGAPLGAAEKAARKLTEDGLTPLLSQAANIRALMTAGLGVDEAVKVMVMYKDIAALGRSQTLSFEEALVNLARAFKTEQSEIGDLAGLTENWVTEIIPKGVAAFKELEGREADLTNQHERSRVKVLGLMEIHKNYAGGVEVMKGGVVEATGQMETAWLELKETMGKGLIGDVATETMRDLTELFQFIEEWERTREKKKPMRTGSWDFLDVLMPTQKFAREFWEWLKGGMTSVDRYGQSTPIFPEAYRAEQERKYGKMYGPSPGYGAGLIGPPEAYLFPPPYSPSAPLGPRRDLAAEAKHLKAESAASRQALEEGYAAYEAILRRIQALKDATGFRGDGPGPWAGAYKFPSPGVPMPEGLGYSGPLGPVLPPGYMSPAEEMENSALQAQIAMSSLADIVVDDLAGGFAEVITSLHEMESVSEGIKSVFGNIAKEIAKAVIKAVLLAAIKKYISGGTDSFGANFGKAMGFSQGGAVPNGPVYLASGGNPLRRGSDSIPAMLTPGEHVLSRDDVRRLGGHDGVRRVAKGGSSPTFNLHFSGGNYVGSGGQRQFAAELHETIFGLIKDNGYRSLA